MLGFGSLAEFSLGEYLFVPDPIPVVIEGGGTSSAGDNDRRHRDPRTRRGLVPPKWISPAPKPQTTPLFPLPPFSAPPLAPADERSPLDLVDPDLIPQDLLGLQDQIFAAQEFYRRGNEQDEQDAADIADVLALLD